MANNKETIQQNANAGKEDVKNIGQVAKAGAKLATGDYAGAAKEVIKNPLGFIKGIIAIILVILIPIACCLGIFFDSTYFFNENTYSNVSNYLALQRSFKQDSSAKTYEYLKEKIYSDIINEIKNKERANGKIYMDEFSDEGFDAIKDVFKNKESLEEIISIGYLNASNPEIYGNIYADYQNVLDEESKVFSILKSSQNGYGKDIVKNNSDVGRTLWDRELVILDFSQYKKDENSEVNASTGNTCAMDEAPKAMYNIIYKNGKFYDYSESVSMYQTMFELYLNGTISYMNTKRLKNTDILYQEKETDFDKIEEKDSLAYLRKLMNKFDKKYKEVINSEHYKNVAKKGTKDEKKYYFCDDYVNKNGVFANAYASFEELEDFAEKMVDIYNGNDSKYGEFYKYYPCSEYKDKVVKVFSTLDSFLENHNAYEKDSFPNYVAQVNPDATFMPQNQSIKKEYEETDEDKELDTSERAEKHLENSADMEIPADEKESYEELNNLKKEAFADFYSNPIFYKNVLKYDINVSSIDYKNVEPKKFFDLNTVLNKNNGQSEDEIGNTKIMNIVKQLNIEVSVDSISPDGLSQIYLNYFYDEILSKEDGINTSDFWDEDDEVEPADVTIKDFLKHMVLCNAGESVDDTSPDYKNIVMLDNTEFTNDKKEKTDKTANNIEKEIASESKRIVPIESLIIDKNGDEEDGEEQKIKYVSNARYQNYINFKMSPEEKLFGQKAFDEVGDTEKYKEISETILLENIGDEVLKIARKNLEKEKNTIKAPKDADEGTKYFALSALVSIDTFEITEDVRKKDSEYPYYKTNGTESYNDIKVSGILNITTHEGKIKEIKCGGLNPSYVDGNAILSFPCPGDISAINSLKVFITPTRDFVSIRNLSYKIGSISDTLVKAKSFKDMYDETESSGMVTAAVLEKAGFITSNYYLQYKTDMFSVLFKSLQIEASKRQFLTDVENIMKDNEGNLLIKGESGKIDGRPYSVVAGDGFIQNKENYSKKTKNFYTVVCEPDSLIYMPGGMELCSWDGEVPKSTGFLKHDAAPVPFVNVQYKLDWWANNWYEKNVTHSPWYIGGGDAKYVKSVDEDGHGAQLSNEYSSYVSFRDNLIQVTILGFQVMHKNIDGELRYLTRYMTDGTDGPLTNYIGGAWNECKYFEDSVKDKNGCLSAYEYFLSNKTTAEKDENGDIPLNVVTADGPVILGSVPQANSLDEDNASTGKAFNAEDVDTYPCFCISVELVSAIEGVFGNLSSSTAVKENGDIGDYNLEDVFDLSQANNKSYVDESSGFCWPLKDSYGQQSVVVANFNGTIVSNEGNNTVVSSKSGGKKFTLKDTKAFSGPGGEFKSGDVIAANDKPTHVLNVTKDNAELTNNSDIYSYFKTSTRIDINLDEARQSNNNEYVSDALALFDGIVYSVDVDENHLVLYNEEENLYCEYEGKVFSPSAFLDKYDYVSKAEPVGSVSHLNTDDPVELANNSFRVSIYSSNDFYGTPMMKKGRIVNDKESMTVEEISCENNGGEIDYLICNEMKCSSVRKIPKSETPITTYIYKDFIIDSKKITDKDGNVEYIEPKLGIGDKINVGASFGAKKHDSMPTLKVEIENKTQDFKQYYNLLDFFPGRAEFARFAKKVKVTVEDSGFKSTEKNESTTKEVGDSLAIKVGTIAKLKYSASPAYEPLKNIQWYYVNDEGKDKELSYGKNTKNKLEINIDKDKRTVELLTDSSGSWTLKAAFIEKENADGSGSDVQVGACVFNIVAIKVSDTIKINYTDYARLEDSKNTHKTVIKEIKTSTNDNPIKNHMWTNTNGEQLRLFNPNRLIESEGAKEITSGDNKGKHLIKMFNAAIIDEKYIGDATVRWTLESKGGAKGLSLDSSVENTNPYTQKKEETNSTGNLIYDGSVMTSDAQYYVLKATLVSRAILDTYQKEDGKKEKAKIIEDNTATINIHIVNPITSFSLNEKAFTHKDSTHHIIYFVPTAKNKTIKLKNYLKFEKLKNKQASIFGNCINPKCDKNGKNTRPLIDVEFKQNKNDILQYVKEKGVIKLNDNYSIKNYESDNDLYDTKIIVNASMVGPAFRYSNIGANDTKSFKVDINHDVRKIVVQNALNSNEKKDVNNNKAENVGIFESPTGFVESLRKMKIKEDIDFDGDQDTWRRSHKKGMVDDVFHTHYTVFLVGEEEVTLNIKSKDKSENVINGVSTGRYITNLGTSFRGDDDCSISFEDKKNKDGSYSQKITFKFNHNDNGFTYKIFTLQSKNSLAKATILFVNYLNPYLGYDDHSADYINELRNTINIGLNPKVLKDNYKSNDDSTHQKLNISKNNGITTRNFSGKYYAPNKTGISKNINPWYYVNLPLCTVDKCMMRDKSVDEYLVKKCGYDLTNGGAQMCGEYNPEGYLVGPTFNRIKIGNLENKGNLYSTNDAEVADLLEWDTTSKTLAFRDINQNNNPYIKDYERGSLYYEINKGKLDIMYRNKNNIVTQNGKKYIKFTDKFNLRLNKPQFNQANWEEDSYVAQYFPYYSAKFTLEFNVKLEIIDSRK